MLKIIMDPASIFGNIFHVTPLKLTEKFLRLSRTTEWFNVLKQSVEVTYNTKTFIKTPHLQV